MVVVDAEAKAVAVAEVWAKEAEVAAVFEDMKIYEEAPPSSSFSSHELGDDFHVRLSKLHRGINLLESFARIMVDSKPIGLWLRADGCSIGPTWVTTSFSSKGSTFIE